MAEPAKPASDEAHQPPAAPRPEKAVRSTASDAAARTLRNFPRTMDQLSK
ncbi:hypothetical protein N177_3707 [Lutibaculum baratangense AMV1]|uniref:Uncharacterized protein n=1 Tax=Lutibaculum baratangense AMV1 TaxID=631454 RepID=V4R8R7_9HYPH|nr:hypothetical protein N177_3707 [Lutibaculum baratangense AMV1]